MPTTIQASDGTVFHLWQGPDLMAPEPECSIELTTLDNDLSDGYRSSILFGSNTGTKSWKLKLPTLAGSTYVPNLTDPNGASLSREQYVWSVFLENKITGLPFAYPDPHSHQYYLVDFADKSLTFSRMRVQLYSTGIELQQRRLPGKTIFNVSDMFGSQPATWMKEGLTGDQSPNGNPLTISGDVIDDGVQNELVMWQFNTITNTGKMVNTDNVTYYDIFLVLKCREAAFGQTSGIVTGQSTARALIGTNGGTKFTDLSLTNFEYRLNGALFPQSNQVAPMNNTCGIVHLRFTAGKAFDGIQIGKDRAVAGTHAEIDVGEIILCSRLLPMYLVRELTEHLAVKWAVS